MDKQILLQYIDLDQEIKELDEERIKIIYSLSAPKVPDGMPRPKNSKSDPVANAAIRLAALSEKIAQKTDELIALRIKIEEAIAALPSKERRVMRLRYIRGLKWAQIAERIFGDKEDYFERADSYLRTVTRIHGRALQKTRNCP